MNQKELNEQLIEVARNGDLKSIKKLVKLGADINTKYWYGIERVNDHLNGYNYIEPDADWGMTPLMFFADRGILTRETLGEFLALGADINETNHFGRTALMLCTVTLSPTYRGGGFQSSRTGFFCSRIPWCESSINRLSPSVRRLFDILLCNTEISVSGRLTGNKPNAEKRKTVKIHPPP